MTIPAPYRPVMRDWKVLFIAAILVVALFGQPLGVLAAELKIGFVDPVTLIEKAPQGEASLKKLEEEFGSRNKEIRELREQTAQLEQEIDKNSLIMSSAELQQKQLELQGLKRQLRRRQQEFNDDYNLRRNEELAKLQQIVTDAIIEIAESEGYDLIVQQAVYASKTINITNDVLEKLGSN